MTNGIDGQFEKSERFEQLALPNLDNVYRAAVALCGRSNEAEDLAQTVFVKALERFDTFELGTNCKAWLFQILRNVWIDQLRHKKVTGSAVTLDEAWVAQETEVRETVWSNAEDLLDSFSDDQIIRAMKQLPDDQRLTLFLVDVEQLSQQEVADITGAAVGTVKSRASRARKELKGRLASYAEEFGFKRRER